LHFPHLNEETDTGAEEDHPGGVIVKEVEEDDELSGKEGGREGGREGGGRGGRTGLN
jgi:hypothetical protein